MNFTTTTEQSLTMTSMENRAHGERIAELVRRLDEAAERLATRLENAGPKAEHASTGWSPAQVGVHVALVNDNFTSVFDGTNPAVGPAPADFQERDWSVIVRGIPSRFEAPKRFVPPDGVSATKAAEMVRTSAARLRAAIATLPPERGRCCLTNPIVGTISVYQAGDWAIAHIIRHNQQAKRLLGQ